jgi:hypothetical protein
MAIDTGTIPKRWFLDLMLLPPICPPFLFNTIETESLTANADGMKSLAQSWSNTGVPSSAVNFHSVLFGLFN